MILFGEEDKIGVAFAHRQKEMGSSFILSCRSTMWNFVHSLLIEMPKIRYLTLEETLKRIVYEDLDNDNGNESSIIVISLEKAETINEEKGNDNIS